MSDTTDNDENKLTPSREKFKFNFEQDGASETTAGHSGDGQESADYTDSGASIDIIKTAVPAPPPAKLSHMLVSESEKPSETGSGPQPAEALPPSQPDRERALPDPIREASAPEPDRKEESEETLAGMIAGRRLDTPEAERTFLLTLSRDQRLKYADLLQAGDQLDFDREKQDLERERIDLERERLFFEQSSRHQQNAAIFATTALRTLLVINGLGCLVLIAVWSYLSAVPTAVFSAQAFLLSLSAMGLGAIAGALTALSAYVTQVLLSRHNTGLMARGLAHTFRIIAVVLALTGFGLFISGLLLAGYGLKSS